MAITPTNIFQYYAALSKKRRLDAKESRVRSREMMISFQQKPVAPISTEDKFVNAQKFFEMGFRAGVREAMAQSQSDPSSGGGLGLGNFFGIGGMIGGITRREQGGPVAKGQSYLVGESGPEIIKPKEDGNVIPNQKIKDVVDNINQSVGRDRGTTTTIIQPQTMIETQFVPQPIPMPMPMTKTVTVEKMSKQKFNNTLAKGIK